MYHADDERPDAAGKTTGSFGKLNEQFKKDIVIGSTVASSGSSTRTASSILWCNDGASIKSAALENSGKIVGGVLPNIINNGTAGDWDANVECVKTKCKEFVCECGADAIMLNCDSLNSKATIYGLLSFFEECPEENTVPVFLNQTVDLGRFKESGSCFLLSQQTIEAFIIAVRHVDSICIGLNIPLFDTAVDEKTLLKLLSGAYQVLYEKCPGWVSLNLTAAKESAVGCVDSEKARTRLNWLYETLLNDFKGSCNNINFCTESADIDVGEFLNKISTNITNLKRGLPRLQSNPYLIYIN